MALIGLGLLGLGTGYMVRQSNMVEPPPPAEYPDALEDTSYSLPISAFYQDPRSQVPKSNAHYPGSTGQWDENILKGVGSPLDATMQFSQLSGPDALSAIQSYYSTVLRNFPRQSVETTLHSDMESMGRTNTWHTITQHPDTTDDGLGAVHLTYKKPANNAQLPYTMNVETTGGGLMNRFYQ